MGRGGLSRLPRCWQSQCYGHWDEQPQKATDGALDPLEFDDFITFYDILWPHNTLYIYTYIYIYGICMDMCGYVCTWVHIYYVDLTLCPCCLCSPTRIACCPASPKPRPCAVVCSVLKHTFHLSAASKESSESQIHLLKIVSLSSLIIYLWYLWSMLIFDKFKVALKCLWFFAVTRFLDVTDTRRWMESFMHSLILHHFGIEQATDGQSLPGKWATVRWQNNAEHNAHNGQWHDFHLTCHVNPFIPPIKQADGEVVVMPLHSQMSQNLMSKLLKKTIKL
jgi:hypothetical protein